MMNEHDAMLQVVREEAFFPPSRMNCSGYEKFNHFISEMARLGQVAMLRQRIGASGKTIALLAEERRAAFRTQIEDADKANRK